MDENGFIPTNFTDAGKLFGIFEIRNVIECAVICLPILFLILAITPFGLTGTIISICVLLIPIGGFSLIGIKDYSLFTFARIYKRFKKNKRVLLYRGSQWKRVK